jgi:hypothetical protein
VQQEETLRFMNYSMLIHITSRYNLIRNHSYREMKTLVYTAWKTWRTFLTCRGKGILPFYSITFLSLLCIIWIRSPNRPARSQSLYRLSYPAHHNYIRIPKFHITFSNSAEFINSHSPYRRHTILLSSVKTTY